MSKPGSLLEHVKTRVNDPVRIADAASSLLKIATALSHDLEFPFDRLSKDQAAGLEAVLTGALEALRGNSVAKPETALRKAKAAEIRLIDEAVDSLRLNALWRKRLRAADTDKGWVLVVEPQGITSGSYMEFAALETLGWRTSVDARYASHYPGNAACVVLRPPRALVAKPKPKPEPEKKKKSNERAKKK